MKPSYYNVVVDVPGEDMSVVYNTRTQAIVALDGSEREVYDFLLAGGEPDENVRGLVEALADEGFLLDDPEDEANLLHYQFERYRYNDNLLELYVAPTMGCNFNCPYCFEKKREGKMELSVQDALVRFIEDQYIERPYKKLKIVWYGGEPLLQIDIIVALSKRFVAFCEAHDVKYVASVISNTSLADEAVQQKLLDAQVWSVMTTIDGVGETHEMRRVSRDGKPTFETILKNVDSMAKKGICVDFRCILEQGNVASCLEVTKRMAGRDNIGIRVKPMRDMSKLEREVPGAAEVRPLAPEDFGEAFWRVFMQGNPSCADYERALAPIRLHCSAVMDRGYAIDERGNAFNCGCAIGDDAKILFNICEPPAVRDVNWRLVGWYGAHNPLDEERCRSCRVLPLCQGGCLRRDEIPFSECNPLRFCIDKMVLGYYRSLQEDD